jgi:hypothetical protein
MLVIEVAEIKGKCLVHYVGDTLKLMELINKDPIIIDFRNFISACLVDSIDE